jgi:hypothetical protein
MPFPSAACERGKLTEENVRQKNEGQKNDERRLDYVISRPRL